MNNKKEDRKIKYKKKLKPKVEVLFNVANTHLQFLEGYVEKQKKQRESFYTLLGAQIFYLNKCKEFNYSGLISQKAKDARDKSSPITLEHFNPRMSSGEELVDYLQKNMENEKEDDMDWILEEYINKWGQYHLTTAKENRELRRAYKKPAKKPADWSQKKYDNWEKPKTCKKPAKKPADWSQKKYDNWEKAETWEKAYYSAGIILTKDTK